MTRSVSIARRLVEHVAQMLDTSPDVDGFRNRTEEECVAAAQQVHDPDCVDLRDDDGYDLTAELAGFTPVHGDDVLPVPPLQALTDGAGAEVDILIGTNSDEVRLFTRLDGVTTSLADGDETTALLSR